jgi:3-oxoadipate enol-lactonase
VETENRGVRLHWDEDGEGSPVLLIMGHLYSSAMWYPLLPALTEQHRAVWFDNRGTGRSGSTRDASMDDLVGDALAVMDAAGLDAAHVVGVSMGGGIALQLAVTAPERVRSLVLGCTAMAGEGHVPGRGRTALAPLAYRIPLRWLRGSMRKGYGSACDPAAAERDLDVLLSQPYSKAGVLAQAKAMQGYAITRDLVAGIEIPTLVQHGTEDTAVAYRQGQLLAEVIPGARLATYEGSGHNYFVSYRERAVADLLGFLAEVDALPVGAA